jgi:hypothetical protein
MSLRTLAGLFLVVFAVLALSGPGRIDIIDGQARYEVARSLWDHGDVEVRDPDVWFPIVPGPDGKIYCAYRLPHSALGVPALALADLAGPPSEARRHFYFLMLSAAAGATLAVAYAVWFFGHGFSPRSAVLWAAAGLFCTPSWYYSTSTFDDIFGATTVVLGLTWARRSRERGSIGWALLAGLAVGAAINWKPPLGIFLLPTLALALRPKATNDAPGSAPVVSALKPANTLKTPARLAAILAGIAVGLVVYQFYEWLRFPPGYQRAVANWSPPVWNDTPAAAAAALLVSPSCGAFWYCPTVLLGVAGLVQSFRVERRWATSVIIACAGFFAVLCALRFFKGDITWGPRYLTPVFAVLWLFVPSAAAAAGRMRTGLILGLGLVVQLLALATDPHRAYIVADFPPHVLLFTNAAYYDLRLSHLFMRPDEIWDVVTSEAEPEAASPAPTPTFALPLPDTKLIEPSVARRYHIFADLRPWWCWQRHLAPAERPVDIGRTAGLLAALGLIGAALVGTGLRRQLAE